MKRELDLTALAGHVPGGRQLDLMRRRSVRRYLPQPIEQDVIDTLLEAAVTAPSAHNRQPWRFAVVRSPGRKAALARAMGDRLRADRERDRDASADIEADVARSFARLTGAPTLIVVCLDMQDMDVYPDALRNHHEYQMAVQSTAMAGQNILVAADVLGLGACWLCAPMFCPDAVRQSLALPAGWQPQGMITLGYPAAPPKPFVRKPVAAVTLLLDDD